MRLTCQILGYFSREYAHKIALTGSFSKPKMHQISLGGRATPGPAGGAYSAPPDLLAELKGPTSKGRGGRGVEKEGKGKGVEERKGRGLWALAPLKWNPAYALGRRPWQNGNEHVRIRPRPISVSWPVLERHFNYLTLTTGNTFPIDVIIITCSTVVLQCYRRQAIPMEQAKIRPSVTLYSMDRSLPYSVWLITSATPSQRPILAKFG